MSIPIIDLFAGPGGLGEGFSKVRDARGRPAFRIAASFEKDASAHQTLELRALFRLLLERDDLEDYWAFTRGSISRAELFGKHPECAGEAKREAVHAELGGESFPTKRLRETIRAALGHPDEPFIVVGGPPCQAYSIVGRARRKGVADYTPESDLRTTLYKEYLQVLADWQPACFVMENVRGILSSRLHGERIFPRIIEDLSSPVQAIRREGRTSLRGACRYKIHSLVVAGEPKTPEHWVVRAEDYGIPQTRHRVILLGIREDVGAVPGILEPTAPTTVKEAISDLPFLRAHPTGGDPRVDAWHRCVLEAYKTLELRGELGERMKQVLRHRGEMKDPGIGGLYVKSTRRKPSGSLKDWYDDAKTPWVLNHETRAHMPSDLLRYLFAAVHGEVKGISPRLADFPISLLPAHKNAGAAVIDGTFDDRFRVQLANQPGTTVTSHISKDGHYFIHHDPLQCRSWTVREAARIQTFPDSYFFCGNRTAQYSQVGNAVPPLLALKIGQLVIESLSRICSNITPAYSQKFKSGSLSSNLD